MHHGGEACCRLERHDPALGRGQIGVGLGWAALLQRHIGDKLRAMSRRIQTLTPQLANQIAAGEVVERPASVAKELLENSIDAGADRIELELEQGGLKLLRVTDNGGGIHPEDLPLALAQHATSKIYTQQELTQVASLGFRGEALASIASVSRFSLCSRFPDQPHAWQIHNQARGKLSAPEACALGEGTCIEVRELFYNVPARRKFMRTERTEFLHVEEVMRRLALSRFDVAFSLSHNGRQSLRLRPATDEAAQRRRIGEILGQGFVREALAVDFRAAGLRLWGYLSPPQHSVSQSSSQYFYLNGRVIRDKLINHAIRQAHLAVLEAGRHPAYVLYLELDPAQVDINVHPTKHEVRFRQTRLVHDFIQRALGEVLLPSADGHEGLAAQRGVGTAPQAASHASAPVSSSAIAEQQQFYRQARALRPTPQPTNRVDTQGLSLLFGQFLLRQREGQVALLEIAALRRLLWRRQLNAALEDGELVATPLLVPEVLRLGESACAHWQQQAEGLHRLGLSIDTLGPGELVVRELPQLMQGMALETVFARLEAIGLAPDEPAWRERLIEALLPLAPSPSLEQVAELLQRAKAQGVDTPWRSLEAQTLRHWLAS